MNFKKLRDDFSSIGKAKDFLYKRKGITYKLTADIKKAEAYTLDIEFADTDISYISVSINGRAAASIAGYTSCGTDKIRHGAYVYKPAENEDLSKGCEIEIFGLPEIKSMDIKEGIDEDIIERAKSTRLKPNDIKSPLNLKNPLQLLINISSDSESNTKENLEAALERMRELSPYAKALGFNGFESYVKWDFIEYEKGVFDWSYYDAVIALASSFSLKWFPLIIGGSAYSLPEWFREEVPGFKGFICQEHGIENNVPTIFNEHQTPYVVRFLHEFGKHYEGNENVFGIRLGPTGNYGESQYPATGNWGYKGLREHMHIGWWAGDDDASRKFSFWLKDKYKTIENLSKSWGEEYSSFDDIKTFLPYQTLILRKRKDFVDFYMHEMTDWCNRWGVWVREELKSHDIYQSAGGWGFCEAGTDFTDQTRGMVPIKGGIRATNEDESYELNFAITRMLSSAARFYDVPFGSEPAGYGTARSVINRLYNIIVNNGQHLFYYGGNFYACDESERFWQKNAPLLDQRAKPLVDIAVLYPDTMTKISDSSIRWLDGSSFFSQVFPLRRKLDYDFCSEQMIIDKALQKNDYKALVFLARNHDGDYVEEDVLNLIDEYVQNGGTVIYPLLRSNAKMGPQTIEGDQKVFERWRKGDTGKGRVIFINTMREPLDAYIDDLADELAKLEGISPLTKKMLTAKKPRGVYISVLETGKLVFYNDLMEDASVELSNGETINLDPVSIKIV